MEVDATALPQAAVIDLRERVAAAQHEHAYREPQHAGYERELHRDIA